MTTDASLSLAIQNLRQKWEEDPTNPLVFQLAEEYRRIERFDLAAEVLQQQVERYPQHFSARVALGRCRMELGEPRLAADVIEPVVAEDPTHLIANKLLAKAYLELGEATRARDRLDLYVLLNDDDWEIDELERRLRDLDAVPPTAESDTHFEALGGGHLTEEQIEQEVFHLEHPDELVNPEPSQPSEPSESPEEVDVSGNLFVDEREERDQNPAILPIEDHSRAMYSEPIAEEKLEIPLGALPDEGIDETPKVVDDEKIDVPEEVVSTDSLLSIPEADVESGTARELRVEESTPLKPPVSLNGSAGRTEEPFEIEPSELKSDSLKRLLASGGIFTFESPSQTLDRGDSSAAGFKSGQADTQKHHQKNQKPAPISRQTDSTVTLGNLYLQQGHHAEARQIFSQVLHREPANLQAQGGIAEIDQVGRKRLSAKDLLRARGKATLTDPGDSSDFNSRPGSAGEKIAVLNQYLGYFKRVDGDPTV